MVTNHFEQIGQELFKQKKLMDHLEAENRELRVQIADLRSGRGIFVDINGIRFALRDDSSLAQTTSASSVGTGLAPVRPASTSPSTSTVATSTPSATPPLNQHVVDAATEVIPEITAQLEGESAKEQASPSNNDDDKNATSGESTFLEEMLIDEFASALTSPNAVWQDSTEKQPSSQQRQPHEPIDEKQKEALRRELTGSYLLE